LEKSIRGFHEFGSVCPEGPRPASPPYLQVSSARYLPLVGMDVGVATFFGLRTAPIRLNPLQQTDVCRVLWESAVRSKVLGPATFCLAFQLLAAASAPAQEPQPPTPTASPFSGIARNVVTWLHHVTRTATHRHRIASSPPLPRPRPAQLTKAPELPATTVGPNETPPTASAIEPVKISPAPAPTIEQDKVPAELPAAAVEPNEAPPSASAIEPIKISPAPTPTIERDTAPTELPAGAVERTKAPGTPARAVLQGTNIPD
jgi:hypothetical protein